MNELLKATVRELVETIFHIVTGPGSNDEKVSRLKRATLALASERASEATIGAALGRPNTGT